MTEFWQVRDGKLRVSPRPLVMGILNVTPDSFSDGGRFLDVEAALARGLALVDEGADILDIGGESTRPGATPISDEGELARVLPVIEKLVGRSKIPLSVDTSKATVARACLEAGVAIINDVTALTGAEEMVQVVRDFGAGVVLMHMQGTPATMQLAPNYDDVVPELLGYFRERLAALQSQGLRREQMVIDPGIGFGKTFEHNLDILRRLPELAQLDVPVCLGVSRKGFIGKILGRPVGERVAGSLAVVAHALAQGAAQVVRVHDVAATRDLVHMWSTLSGQ